LPSLGHEGTYLRHLPEGTYLHGTCSQLTIQTDVAMPGQLLEGFMHDETHLQALRASISQVCRAAE